jgi:hypothetical protein
VGGVLSTLIGESGCGVASTLIGEGGRGLGGRLVLHMTPLVPHEQIA